MHRLLKRFDVTLSGLFPLPFNDIESMCQDKTKNDNKIRGNKVSKPNSTSECDISPIKVFTFFHSLFINKKKHLTFVAEILPVTGSISTFQQSFRNSFRGFDKSNAVKAEGQRLLQFCHDESRRLLAQSGKVQLRMNHLPPKSKI